MKKKHVQFYISMSELVYHMYCDEVYTNLMYIMPGLVPGEEDVFQVRDIQGIYVYFLTEEDARHMLVSTYSHKGP